MNKFIVIEGIDGSGKSTTAKYLSKKLSGVYFYSPPYPFRFLKKLADTKFDYNSRYIFYILSNYFSSLLISIIRIFKPVVCDWYYYSTIAYHSILLNRKLSTPKVLQPDLILYISTDFETVKERLNARTNKNRYEDFELLAKVKNYYEEIFRANNNVIYINGSENLDSIYREIKKMVDYYISGSKLVQFALNNIPMLEDIVDYFNSFNEYIATQPQYIYKNELVI